MKRLISVSLSIATMGLLLTSPNQASAQELTTGLLSYWALDGNGEDTASDYTGHASTVEDDLTPGGTAEAATITSAGGLFGGAGEFERDIENDGRLVAADSADLNREGLSVSISLWAQFDNSGTNWQGLVIKGEGANYRVHSNRNANSNFTAFGGGGGDATGNDDIKDTAWHHIVATTDAVTGTVTVYVDGVLDGSGSGSGIVNEENANSGELWIGNNPGSGTNPPDNRMWDGLIDDVAMWDRALTLDEVQSIYNAGDTSGAPLSSLLGTPDDTDDDGLPDTWEMLYGLDHLDDGLDAMGNPIPGNPNGAAGDPDEDLSLNIDEFNNLTFPDDADSDNDDLSDKVETNTGTWVDANNTGTDPRDADTDDDDLLDGVEDNGDAFVSAEMTGSDPHNAHSDPDTMPDGYEVQNGLDPNVDDSLDDEEPDGVNNITEFTNGTDPQKADTDADGYDDLVETNTGTFNSLTDTGTDPLNPDTDGDLVLDGTEDNGGMFVSETMRGTDPLDVDTDNDLTHDGAEIAAERDPLDPSDAAPSGLGRKLVAYWNFDNNLVDQAEGLSVDSAVADDGAFGGTEGDAVFAASGFFGSSALETNGGAGFVEVAASVDTLRATDNAVSVSTWFQAAEFTVRWQNILSHGEGNQYRLARRHAESTVAFAGGTGDIPGGGVGPELALDTWHHMVGISDPVAGTTSIYVNGSLIATGDAPALEDISSSGDILNLYIGSNPEPTATNREWNGLIDDMAIWGRALTQAEVLSIWADGAGASIESLLASGADFFITEILYDKVNDTFTLSWTATEGKSYGVYYNTDLTELPNDIDDAILADPASVDPLVNFEDGIFTYGPFPNPIPGATELFFRAELAE